MSAESNDGRSQDPGLVRRRVWVGTPFATHQIDIFEPAESDPEPRSTPWELARERAIHGETDTKEEVTPAAEVVLLGEEPRTFEG